MQNGKSNKIKKLNHLLQLLTTKEMRYSDLKRELGVSHPTLADYIKYEEALGRIEPFLKTEGDRRETWYRIKPENRHEVDAYLLKTEAIQFILGISSPVHYFKRGKLSVAAFTSVSEKMNRKEWQGKVKGIVNRMAFLSKIVPSLRTDQKMAIVIMVEGKKR